MIPQPPRRMKLGQNYLAYLHLCTTLAQARPAQIVPIGLMQPGWHPAWAPCVRRPGATRHGRRRALDSGLDAFVSTQRKVTPSASLTTCFKCEHEPDARDEEDQMCPSRSPKFPILGSPQFPRNKSPGDLFARVNCGRPTPGSFAASPVGSGQPASSVSVIAGRRTIQSTKPASVCSQATNSRTRLRASSRH